VGSTVVQRAHLTAPVDGVSNRRRAAAPEAGAQARSPAGHRVCFEPWRSLRAVAARKAGRLGGAAQWGSLHDPQRGPFFRFGDEKPVKLVKKKP